MDGQYALTHSNGQSECVDLGSSTTAIPISGDPQPGPPRNTDPPSTAGTDLDVLGWGYTLEWDGGRGGRILQSLIDLLPENEGVPHSVVKSCAYETNRPANNKFDASWLAVGASSVKYVGDEHGAESSKKDDGGAKTVPPGPTTKDAPVQVSNTVPASGGMTPTQGNAPTQTSPSTVSSAFAAPMLSPGSAWTFCGMAAVFAFLS